MPSRMLVRDHAHCRSQIRPDRSLLARPRRPRPKPGRHRVATATPRSMTCRVRLMCAVAAFEIEGATDPGAGRPAKGFSQQQRGGTAATARDLAARRLVPRLPTVIRTRTDFKREVLV
jgi:hypothetical protein